MELRRHRGLSAVLGAVLLASSMIVGGCGSGDSGATEDAGLASRPNAATYDAAIVYADRSNSGANASNALKHIEDVAASEGFLACVLADGKPTSVSDTFELTEQNGRKRESELKQKIASVSGMDWSARTAEADIFAAITEADRALGGASGDVERSVIIVDSGISTSGPISFMEDQPAREGLLDPDAFVQSLRQSGDLGKLENVDRVIWYGLGEASDPQESPNEGTRRAMQDLYEAIFAAGGVEEVEFMEAGGSSAPSSGLPAVTPIELPKIALDPDGNPVGLGDTLVFNEAEGTALTFETATSAFVDGGAAAVELEDGIAQLLSFPEMSVAVRGYTDTVGDEAANQVLSEERARTVADLLVSAGVSPDRITVIGMGEDSTHGEGDVAANRRVELQFS